MGADNQTERSDIADWLDQMAGESRQLAAETDYLPIKVLWQRTAIMAAKAARLLRQPGDGLAAYGLVGDG